MAQIMKRIGSLAVAQNGVARPVLLEEMLAECMKWGRPRLHCFDDLTWSCSVKLNTTHAFLNGEVSSGFGHETPAAAVTVVLEKLRQL
jgi:hypothetical protein